MTTLKKVVLAAVLAFAAFAAAALPVGHQFMDGPHQCAKKYSQEVCERRAQENDVMIALLLSSFAAMFGGLLGGMYFRNKTE